MRTSSTQKSYNPRFGVQTGDIWRVGNQYLVCGDAADPSVKETVSRLLPVEAILTSPPYPKVRKYQEIGDVPFAVVAGILTGLAEIETVQSAFVNLGIVYTNGTVWRYWETLIEAFPFPLFQWIVWDKLAPIPRDENGRLLQSFEFVFHFKRPDHRPPLQRSRKLKTAGKVPNGLTVREPDGQIRRFEPENSSYRTPEYGIEHNVIRLPNERRRDIRTAHPAVFTVELPQWVMNAYRYQYWLDPFVGSGSTLIAAEREGLRSVGIEIVPYYADLALARCEKEGLAIERIHRQ
jgi:DNA modification methylase